MFGIYDRSGRLGTGEVFGRLLKTWNQQETNKYCGHCGQHVLALRPATPRLRNLLWTVLTLGAWSVVWLIQSRRRPGWRCAQCGRQVT